MAFPLAIPAVLAVVALVASQMGKSDTRTDPNPLFDDNLPPDSRRNLENAILAGGAWMGFFASAYHCQTMGYPRTAQTLLAVANKGRQEKGLVPIAFPISDAAYAQAAAESRQGTAWADEVATTVANPGAAPVAGPGGVAYGIPPTPQRTAPPGSGTVPIFAPPPAAIPGAKPPAATPGATPGFVPQSIPGSPPGIQVTPLPGGGAQVVVPGLGSLTIPPGIMGQPPATPPPSTYNPPPGGRPPLPGPPPAPPPAAKPPVASVAYPKGTHTRPDGTVGYSTQPGDISVAIIAKKFGKPNGAGDFMSANPGVYWEKNFPGTDLNVPAEWISSPPTPGPQGKRPPMKGGASPAPGISVATPGITLTLPPDVGLPPDM